MSCFIVFCVFRYVGMVSEGLALIQHETRLHIVNYHKLRCDICGITEIAGMPIVLFINWSLCL